jgi:hypothetical protein
MSEPREINVVAIHYPKPDRIQEVSSFVCNSGPAYVLLTILTPTSFETSSSASKAHSRTIPENCTTMPLRLKRERRLLLLKGLINILFRINTHVQIL